MNRLPFVAGAALLLASCQPPTDGQPAPPPAAPPQSGKLPDPPLDDRRGYPGGKVPVPKTADELCAGFQGDELDFKLEVGEGEKLFPLYREVLQDPKRDANCAGCVLSILWRVAQDPKLLPEVRTQFLDLTMKHLGGRDVVESISALALLRVIGSERDTAPVANLLFGERTETRYAAAKTLAAIGGPRDVLVLDTVITNADRYHDAKGNRLLPAEYDVKHFEKCKGELEARLNKQEKAEPKK